MYNLNSSELAEITVSDDMLESFIDFRGDEWKLIYLKLMVQHLHFAPEVVS